MGREAQRSSELRAAGQLAEAERSVERIKCGRQEGAAGAPEVRLVLVNLARDGSSHRLHAFSRLPRPMGQRCTPLLGGETSGSSYPQVLPGSTVPELHP